MVCTDAARTTWIRVRHASDWLAGVEAEGPDLVAGVEESVKVCVRGVDVQSAPGHGEATRVPGVRERREHLDIADGTL